MASSVGGRRLYRWRVPCAFAFAALILWWARPSPASLGWGLALALPGLALRLWAAGHIEKARRLATGGPYRHTQHPLYLGSALIGLAIGVASAHPLIIAAALVYLGSFLPLALRDETSFLHQRFGLEYEAWAAQVPFFLPRLSPAPAGPAASHFEWRRAWRNHEWKPGLALLGLLLLFGWRAGCAG